MRRTENTTEEAEMEPYLELGDAVMKPHAELERLDKLGRKRGEGIE